MDAPAILETRLTLIDRVCKQDPAAWDEFVRLYTGLIRAYILKISTWQNRWDFRDFFLRNNSTDDVLAEVMLKLLERLPKFKLDPAKGTFRTWLWRVTFTTTVDWIRANCSSRLQTGLAVDPEGGATAPPPDDEAIRGEERRILGKVLARAAAEMQANHKWDCFRLHFLEKRPSKEVAAELGVSESAVNTNTSRVLKRVRELSADYGLRDA